MGGRQGEHGAVWAQELLERVERWRRVRRKGAAMPGELWEAAAELAEEHGVSAVSRQLRLSYESLRRWVGQEKARGAGFVEVSAAQLLASAGQESVRGVVGAEVEVWGGDGARLWLRLGDLGRLDVAGVVKAFLSCRG